MRFALFDNSSLTAIQRILGKIPVGNKYVIDGDVLALESYMQAILFYDKILYIDDYKEQFQKSRRDFFSDMSPYSPSEAAYKSLLSVSKQAVEGVVPHVRAGRLREDFRDFFKLLRMNVLFTWDMASSSYYLTVKMLEAVGGLDADKYGTLHSMIRAELTDQKTSDSPSDEKKALLIDRYGKEVVFDAYFSGLAGDTNQFFAGLNWLAFRTIFYTIAAREMGVDLFLYPIRQSFQINSLYKFGVFDEPTFRELLNTLSRDATDKRDEIVSPTQPIVKKLSLPFFVSWLAYETGDPHSFVKTAYEIRKDDMFVQARQQLIELERIVQKDEFRKEANKLERDVSLLTDDICRKFSIRTPQGLTTSSLVLVWNLASAAFTTTQGGLPTVPEVSEDSALSSLVRNLRTKKGFGTVYKNLLQDLAKVDSFGRLNNIIRSRLVFYEDASYYPPKFEERKFYGKESDWKKQM